ncbi:MAG: hypothetical protein HY696_07675 [Deltaproteobacteria bacterium]|nr:hypothetical protein [Deltaproteobacteria bacterium]
MNKYLDSLGDDPETKGAIKNWLLGDQSLQWVDALGEGLITGWNVAKDIWATTIQQDLVDHQIDLDGRKMTLAEKAEGDQYYLAKTGQEFQYNLATKALELKGQLSKDAKEVEIVKVKEISQAQVQIAKNQSLTQTFLRPRFYGRPVGPVTV